MSACALCGGSALEPLFEKNGYRYERCRSCRTVRAGLPGGPPSFYGDLYGRGALEREAAKAFAPGKRRKYARLLRDLGRAGDSLLDVGCSVGGFLEAGRAAGAIPFGLETSILPAREAARRGLRVAVGDAGALPFPGARFDLVRMNAVLEHLLDPRAALREAARVLRPGGLLQALTLSADSWSFRLLGPRWRYAGVDGHVHFFPRETLRRAVEEAGLRPVAIRTAGVRLAAASPPWLRPLERIADLPARLLGAGHRIEIRARR